MAKDVCTVRIDADDKKRIENYLANTYKGSIAELCRRLMFEKVAAWEAMQREEQRREAEHEARMASLRA